MNFIGVAFSILQSHIYSARHAAGILVGAVDHACAGNRLRVARQNYQNTLLNVRLSGRIEKGKTKRMNKISKLLLATRALEIAPPGKVFWYTSGTVGPFYLNAHFLYGGRKKAEDLLAFIDQNITDRAHLVAGLLARPKNYAEDAGYRTVIDAVVALTKNEISLAQIDYVSGGERRDWFFSLAAARRLQKPVLVLFKDRSAFIIADEKNHLENNLQAVKDLNGARVLHVADLVTEASSYVRAWLPAIQNRGGRLIGAINVVDRGQGGEEILQGHGVSSHHLVQLGSVFFEQLAEADYLSSAAARQLSEYHRQPRESMKKFLEEHPGILREALRGKDTKNRQRARQLVEENLYGCDEKFLAEFRNP
jgi:orotate phosphoribosyltransferase